MDKAKWSIEDDNEDLLGDARPEENEVTILSDGTVIFDEEGPLYLDGEGESVLGSC